MGGWHVQRIFYESESTFEGVGFKHGFKEIMNGIIQSHWAVIGSIKCNISYKNFLGEILLIEFR